MFKNENPYFSFKHETLIKKKQTNINFPAILTEITSQELFLYILMKR